MDVLVDTILSAINQVHDNEASYRYEDQQNMSSLAELLIVGELTSEKWLRVTVENFGAPANVNEINHYLQGIQEMKVSKDSFGLRNVYERIKRYYGEQGNLVYRINSRNHTEAVVEVQSCGQYELAPREASFLQYR